MKIELKNIKHSEWGSEETQCFQANMYLNGKLVGYCKNDGKGECTSYNRIPNVDYKVIREMEEYCKGLPPIEYDSHLRQGEKFSIDMNLEHYLDILLEKHLESKHKAKMFKKLEKEMQKAILIGDDTQYNTISFKLPLKEMWENYPDHFKLTLKSKLEKYADKGYRLLNTNIPQQFLNL
jgi:hypothetical protein